MPQNCHFVFIRELENDRFSIHPPSTEHLCGQLKAKGSCCPLHRKKTCTGRSVLKPLTSGWMVHLARFSSSMSATLETISFSSGLESMSLSLGVFAVFSFLGNPLPAPAPLSFLLRFLMTAVNDRSDICTTSTCSLVVCLWDLHRVQFPVLAKKTKL